MHIKQIVFLILFSNCSTLFHNQRLNINTLGDYHIYLMQYNNIQTFRYVYFYYRAFNIQIYYQTTILYQQIFQNSENKIISIGELYKIANNLNSHLKDIISKKRINIYGTKLYQINTSYKFEIGIKNLNGQILFLIANAMDIQ